MVRIVIILSETKVKKSKIIKISRWQAARPKGPRVAAQTLREYSEGHSKVKRLSMVITAYPTQRGHFFLNESKKDKRLKNNCEQNNQAPKKVRHSIENARNHPLWPKFVPTFTLNPAMLFL